VTTPVAQDYEVPEPILNSAFEEPGEHWYIREGEIPDRRPGRRKAMVFQPRDQAEAWDVVADPTLKSLAPEYDRGYELVLVNQVRERVKAWRDQGYPGATGTTLELFQWWRREGRKQRLFFTQLEAVETIAFLTEARQDFRQGLQVPRDEPSDDRKSDGYSGFTRYACKMATGSGKTTVMAMLAAWSILNKLNDRSNASFSDVVIIVCPNVTIRDRLQELNPGGGEASLYRTRDLVPPHLMALLSQGKVAVTNWHVFEPQTMQVGGVSAKVARAGVPVRVREKVTIGPKKTVARNIRYLTEDDLARQIAAGIISVMPGTEERDKDGTLKRVSIESLKYVESDTALLTRVLGRDIGSKQNVLVMNDEAHHAYRIRREGDEEQENDLFGEDEEAEEFFKEATVWVEGLDKIHKHRGINFCIDLSATPYYLGRVAQAGRPFPWVVSDFGLIDAIESGLVKIPQLAVRDSTGAEIPGYFNIWRWIQGKLTPAEAGGRRGSPKPEAILKYAHTPIAILGGYWEESLTKWSEAKNDPRPPVFILVCKNTAIAKVMYEWLAEDKKPTGIPSAKIEGFRNRDGQINTIRVDSKVVHETDSGQAKGDEARWMRFTLDTVGKVAWPADRQGRPIYPDGFEALAKKLERGLHPPGRDIRCIVSVGMLTEGWDANTVTHIVGLRPFMSQLLCEQVVGRGLRRVSYDVGENGKFTEEVAQVFGVPFEVIPFKANQGGAPPPPVKRYHVHAIPTKSQFEIRFPRVEGYTQAIRNRVTVDWSKIPELVLDGQSIPKEVEMKGALLNNKGRPSVTGPGRVAEVSLAPYHAKLRIQELVFDMARDLTRDFLAQRDTQLPAHVLFPQLVEIVRRYVMDRVTVIPPASRKDLFLSPYYGWVIERLVGAIQPDTSLGEVPEIPRYESARPPGSTGEVSFWTSRDVREVVKSHVNFMVADTKTWEQSVAYTLDKSDLVEAFVKNAGLGFAIPYLNNGQTHDYVPDFIARLKGEPPVTLILEVKGFDPLEQVKRAAAERWVAAVNAEGSFGRWGYAVAKQVSEVPLLLAGATTVPSTKV
jgi:type III restriction enzyme